MKKQATWTNGTKDERDDYKSKQILEIARNEFELEAQTALFVNPEIRSATYAIIEALPAKLRKKVTNGAFVDIASIILLQRAAAQYQVGLTAGLAQDYQTTASPTNAQDRVFNDSEKI